MLSGSVTGADGINVLIPSHAQLKSHWDRVKEVSPTNLKWQPPLIYVQYISNCFDRLHGIQVEIEKKFMRAFRKIFAQMLV